MKALAAWLLLIVAGLGFAQSDPPEAPIAAKAVQEQLLDSPALPVNPNSSSAIADPATQASEILSNPLYRESLDTKQGESWLAQALEKLFETIAKLFDRKSQQRAPGVSASGGTAIIWTVIVILIAILAGFLIFMLAQIRFKKKAHDDAEEGLVSDIEAQRSADQWLTEADKLSSAGEFRLAIRCLYLACLVRLDEKNFLRFERHETNWEHLGRYRDQPNKPGGFDLQPATQKFDLAWYGMLPQSMDDVNWFKAEYTKLLAGLPGARK